MPRKPRIHFPGAVYHVMLRGNDGQDIFFTSADRSRFLLLLQQGLDNFDCRIHAYCLMDNHIHLAMQVADIPLSKIMQNIGFRYTQYINRKLKRTGHLFQGRFKALLIDEDSYLLELVRYIHINPLRAGIVEDLNEYPWTSHHCYRKNIATPWLTTAWVLSQFDPDEGKAKQQYWQFVQDGFTDGYEKKFHCGTFEGRALGDDRFIERAFTLSEQNYTNPVTIDAIIATVCDCHQIAIADLSTPGRLQLPAEARAVAAWLVRQSNHLKLTDLGSRLKRDISGLSRAATRIKERAAGDEKLQERLDWLKEQAFKSVSQA